MEKIFTLETIDQVAKDLLSYAQQNQYTVIAFFGKMGVGKTTLIKAICKQLNVIDTVQSPTFAIVNQYLTTDGTPVFHFDFYRINSLEEAINIGIDEYFYSGYLCLIEWAEKIEPLLPENSLKVYLEEIDHKTRKIKF